MANTPQETAKRHRASRRTLTCEAHGQFPARQVVNTDTTATVNEFEDVSKVLAAVVTQFAVESMVLCGKSWGGAMAHLSVERYRVASSLSVSITRRAPGPCIHSISQEMADSWLRNLTKL